MTRNCPSCGAPATAGRFCSECGAPLAENVACASCGAALPPGARFCNQCGSPAGAAARPQPGESTPAARAAILPWVVAGVALLALLAIVVLPRLRPSEPGPSAAVPAGPPGDASAVDISAMTPRERADRLFNRVMQSVSTGDSAQARAFLPMALAAYEQVPDLDLDGRYHDAVLHLIDGDPAAARAQADSILAAHPAHLFGLFTAAQAEQAMGREAVARGLYERFLEHYEAEIARDLPEYRDHARVLPINRAEAERMTGGA